MSLTDSEIKAAIEAWAEAKVDEEIAGQIKTNTEYLEKYPQYRGYGNAPIDPDSFDREEIRDELVSEFYSEASDEELPGLGLVQFVQSDRVNDEQWRVLRIDGLYYMISIYYSSYADDEYWQDGTFVRVTPHQVTKTEYRPV